MKRFISLFAIFALVVTASTVGAANQAFEQGDLPGGSGPPPRAELGTAGDDADTGSAAGAAPVIDKCPKDANPLSMVAVWLEEFGGYVKSLYHDTIPIFRRTGK